MTTELRRPQGDADSGVAGWKVSGAYAAIFFERLFPALLPILAPAFVLIVAGLFGIWRSSPAILHPAALLVAAIAVAYGVWRYGREVRWPSRREALARLEEDGRLGHAPLQALEDEPFAGDGGEQLWRAHLEAMRLRGAGARVLGPKATMDARDPWALRYGALGLLAVAFVAAGPERWTRIAETFNPTIGLGSADALAELWIEPPAYTGKAPIYLVKSGERLAGLRQQLDVPEGSIAVAQAVGAKRVSLRFATEEGAAAAERAEDSGRMTLVLRDSGLLRFRVAGAEGRFPVGVAPDESPTAYFIEPPGMTDDARLALAFFAEDDYAVTAVRLNMRLDPEQERPLDAPEFDRAALGQKRSIELEGLSGRSGERRADIDLQSDPWAGLFVIASLSVVDGAGQEGATGEERFRLPAKPFFNPLARAVVEQRQTLAVAAEDWRRAGRSFDALTLAPDRFYESPTDFLLMRTAFWRVMRQNGGGFATTVADFWPLALQLEDEALELARRRLEAARDKLREALEAKAGEAEIARLVEELRDAMRQYLQALAESGARMAEGESVPTETIDEGDLNDMLDSIRDLSRSGANNAARQALSDLEALLDNMRLSSSGAGSGGRRGQSGGLAGQAGDLIGRQRDLANRSFERSQAPGAVGDDLAGEEGSLAGDLEKLLESLSGAGEKADPGAKGEAALKGALGAMRNAEDGLEADDFDAAGTAMEEAIARLRDGAEALAAAQGAAERERLGEGEGRGPALDPLGRPIGEADGRGVEVPEEWDAQRARDVLKELRRRLGQGARSEDEIRYLERLLERF